MMMMHLVHELPAVSDREGNVYRARVIGAPAKDGLWDGAIELQDRSGQRLVTPVETRQANLADLVYWSTGLSGSYVEGALTRALAAAAAVAAEASGDRAVEVFERGLRFRRPVRRAVATGRSAASKRTPRPAPRAREPGRRAKAAH